MELFLTRADIRLRLRVATGQATSDALAGPTFDRHNAFIQLANAEVLSRRQWRATEREYLFTFGVDQRFYNYPANCRGENIKAIGVWSNGVDTTSGEYIPLRRRPIPLVLDTDPISDAGGDAAAAYRGVPTRYECKNQIEVWQRADIPYLGKIDHTINPDLALDTDVSVVDGIAILQLSLEQEWDILGEPELAAKARSKGDARIKLISGWQHSGEVVTIDDMANFDEQREVDPFRFIEKRPG